jgi:hypothetical protein
MSVPTPKDNLKERLSPATARSGSASSAGSTDVLDLGGLSFHPLGEQRFGCTSVPFRTKEEIPMYHVPN